MKIKIILAVLLLYFYLPGKANDTAVSDFGGQLQFLYRASTINFEPKGDIAVGYFQITKVKKTKKY